MHWQPGQSLPRGPLPIASESGTSIELQSMLQSMQHTIKSNFEEVKGKLVELDGRITSMEEKQLQLEKDYRRPGTSSSSKESASDRTRKQRTPSELQVSIFPIYVLSYVVLLITSSLFSPHVAQDKNHLFITYQQIQS